MPPLSPIVLPKVALDFMNDDHAHAASLLEAVAAELDRAPIDTARLSDAWQAFLTHNREHFAREEALMQRHGFPPYPMHKAEHDQVLAQFEALARAIAAGTLDDALREVLQRDIPSWLVQHVQTMDMVTARWLAAQAGTA